MINGTLFEGFGGSALCVHSCELDGGNEVSSDAEETLKERNRRLLAKERERLNQKKIKTPMQKAKYKDRGNISQAIEVKNISAAENRGNERTSTRSKSCSKQREIARVDRRWEFEVVSRMKAKLQSKVEKSGKTTVRREVGWRTRYFPKVFDYVVKIYSSSASRFAAFKSNRSYIPGD